MLYIAIEPINSKHNIGINNGTNIDENGLKQMKNYNQVGNNIVLVDTDE